MANAFDQMEARIGAITLARFSNAFAAFNGGGQVSAIFDDSAMDAGVGAGGAHARRPKLCCMTANVGGVVRGSTAVVTYRGVQTSYVVDDVVDDRSLLQTTFELRRP
jgi:hypothetical protein